MSTKTVLLLFLLLACAFVQAQKGSIRGILQDSITKETLPLASITVFAAKDTSVITYRLSGPEGEFQVPSIPLNTPCRLLITFQGYAVFRREFILTKEKPALDFDTVSLWQDAKAMEEVLVTAERPPVQMRNDTLEFNANAFKTLPAAVVHDLLKKLPGVDIDLDGNITVRGRKVNRLLVDGREFFGGDQQIATRNLPANLVDKIQVVDDKRELNTNPLVRKNEVGQVINIKLKKSVSQGWFGRTYAGKGTENRHEAGGIINHFRGPVQISALGYSNNVNKPGFTLGDLQNPGRSGGTGTYVRSGGEAFGEVNNYGIQRSTGGGLNLNIGRGKGPSVNLQYFYGRVRQDYEQRSSHQRFFCDTVLFTPSSSVSQSNDYKHTISGNIDWEIDSLTTFSFRPSVSLSNVDRSESDTSSTADNFKGLVNSNAATNFSTGFDGNYQLSAYFNKMSRRREGRSFTLSSAISSANNNNSNYTNGLYRFFVQATNRDSLLNQLQERKSGDFQGSIEMNYREPFSKTLLLTLSHQMEYIREENSLQLYTNDLTSPNNKTYNADLSSGVWRNGWNSQSTAILAFQTDDWNISPSLNFQQLQNNNRFLKNPSVNRRFSYLYPSLDIAWKNWHLNYGAYISEQQAADLQPIIDISDPLRKQFGNPALKPVFSRNFNISYHQYFAQSGNSFNISVGGSFIDNNTFLQTFIDSNRVAYTLPVNIDGVQSYHANASYNQQLEFNQDFRLSVRPQISWSINRNFVSVNGNKSEASYVHASGRLSLLLNFKDKIELNQLYRLNINSSIYANKSAFPDLKVMTHSSESEIIVRWPKHFVWESIVNYSYNPRVPPGIRKSVIRWNSGLNYLFLKEDKGQLRLSVYDLLNQNVNVYRYTGEGSIMDNQVNSLQRYFLFSFVYNIRSFGGNTKKVGGRDRSFELW